MNGSTPCARQILTTTSRGSDGSRGAEEWEAREQLVTVNRGRNEGGKLQLATVGETVTIQRGREQILMFSRYP